MTARHTNIEDKICGVSCGGQNAPPLRSLVHRAEVVWERAELGDLHGDHPQDWHWREQDLRRKKDTVKQVAIPNRKQNDYTEAFLAFGALSSST